MPDDLDGAIVGRDVEDHAEQPGRAPALAAATQRLKPPVGPGTAGLAGASARWTWGGGRDERAFRQSWRGRGSVRAGLGLRLHREAVARLAEWLRGRLNEPAEGSGSTSGNSVVDPAGFVRDRWCQRLELLGEHAGVVGAVGRVALEARRQQVDGRVAHPAAPEHLHPPPAGRGRARQVALQELVPDHPEGVHVVPRVGLSPCICCGDA